MRARDIMTTKVQAVRAETPIGTVATLMAKKRISGVPVVDGRRHVIGIVTEGDLLHRRETGTERKRSWLLDLVADPAERAREFIKARGRKAAQVMTRTVFSVAPDAELSAVANLLEQHNIKRVPVVEGGRLVGVISRGDLVRALSESVRSRRPSHATDAAINAALQKELRATGWADTAFVSVTVSRGVVELAGLVTSREARDALIVLAEGVEGVRRVKDSLRVGLRPAFTV